MAVGSRLVSLVTLSSLAVLICSFNASPVTALEISHNNARSLHGRGHDALAKRKRPATKKSKRCKPKAAPAPSSSKADKPASSTKESKPKPSQGGGDNGGFDLGGINASQPVHHNSGGDGNGKAGLAWANGDQFLDKWNAVHTMYTWSPACPAEADKLGITCCPMVWGWNQLDQFNQVAAKADSLPCVMGMNEPEISGQSNMSPESGAQLWNQAVRPILHKVKGPVYSPAPTSDPAGKKWLQTFFKVCGEKNGDHCGVTHLAVHYYDVSVQGFKDYLEDLHNTFGLDIAVTEFACHNFNGGAQCTKDEIWNFQSQMTAFFESTPWIHKYFPWGAMQNLQGVNPLNSMMDGNGGINALGKAYLGL